MYRIAPWFIALLGIGAGCGSEEAKHKAAGNVLFKSGDLKGAANEYRLAVEINPKDPSGHTLLGNAYFEQQNFALAEAEYERALTLDPVARGALQGLATLKLRLGARSEAKALFERMVAREPRDAEAQSALGKLLFMEKDLDGAERHLREALVVAQNDTAALYALGLVLAKKRDQEQANAMFDRLEQLTPGKAYAPYGRAVAAALGNHADEGLRWLAVALERGVDDVGEVERDESFATLKALPKFSELLAQVRTRAPPNKGSPQK